MRPEEIASLALSLEKAEENAHFGKRDFRVGARIFMSLPADDRAVLKLSPDEQMLLATMHPALFSPLPNAWGMKGWTNLALPDAPADIVLSALRKAHAHVAGKPRKKQA